MSHIGVIFINDGDIYMYPKSYS